MESYLSLVMVLESDVETWAGLNSVREGLA